MNKKRYYGEVPKLVGFVKRNLCTEMMFYQDMPIKLPGGEIKYEDRLNCFSDLVFLISEHFTSEFGNYRYEKSYVYISAKRLFQPKHEPFNRPGWHCDGYMSDDINYIWSDSQPTIFNVSEFHLSPNDIVSIKQMEEQALPEHNMVFPVNSILMLDQYNVHRVADVEEPGMRTFVKITFSYDKFDLEGNTRNYLLDYNWTMRPRSINRNIPQSKNTNS